LSSVVDSSVLVAALVDSGPTGTWAEQVLAGGNLCAPELAKVEAMNTIRRLEHAKQIPTAEANLDVHALSQLEIELFPFEPFARRVWELRYAVTCYDAWYVAVAEAVDLPLATLDHRLSRANGPACKFLIPR
jgi:predicted nucleic acid-binding protein